MSCPHLNVSVFALCPQCGELNTPSEKNLNSFKLFELPVRYFIDPNLVQSRFYDISRKLHPDRHQKSEKAVEQATHWFAVINQAQAQLKSETERAELLFEMAGFKPQKVSLSLPQDLASDYFDLQEVLEDSSVSDDERKEKLNSFLKLIKKMEESSVRRHTIFREWEAAGTPLDTSASKWFERAAIELGLNGYLASMKRDLLGRL